MLVIATQRLGVTNYCSLSSSPESRRCVCTYCAIVAVSVSSVLRWPGPGSESACCCPIPGSRLSGNKDGLLAQISAIACTHQAGYTLELRTIHRFPQSPRRPLLAISHLRHYAKQAPKRLLSIVS